MGQIEFRVSDGTCFIAKEYDELNFFTYNYITYPNGYTVFVDVKYSDVTDVWKGIIADVQNDFRIEATNNGFGCYSQHSTLDDTRFLSFPYDRNQRVKLVMKVEPFEGNTKISLFTSYGATGSFLLAGDKISQANFLGFSSALAKTIGQSEKDISLQACYHSFDGGINHLLSPLLLGGTVVIPESEEGFDLEEFTELCDKYQVSLSGVVPSVFNLLPIET